jgi:transposase InsO family protein
MVQRDPSKNKAGRINKLGDRGKKRERSKWDRKIHEGTGLTYNDLRYRVYQTRRDGSTTEECARMFKVSKGFVSKWYNIGKLSAGIGGGVIGFSFLSLPMGREQPPRVRDRINWKVVNIRRRFPWMGAAKIKAYGNIGASPTTIQKVIKEEGLASKPRKRSRRTYVRFERLHSLSLLQIDLKRWENGVWSIWAIDDHSGMILGVEVVSRPETAAVIRLMEGIVRRFGVPEQVLSDNGAQFTSMRGTDHIFDRWCASHGIKHVTGGIASPETQGKIERSHRSAMDETKHLGKISGTEARKKVLLDWIDVYNTERPHRSLDHDVPVNVFLRDLKNQDAFLDMAFTR